MDAIQRYFSAAQMPMVQEKPLKTKPAAAQGEPVQTDGAVRQDTVTLGTEEGARDKDEALRKALQEKEEEMAAMREEMKSAEEQGEAMRKKLEEQNKCFLIASRIMSGDKVPPEDYRFLAEKNTKLYAQALTLRVTRENPKKHKPLSREEKQDATQPATPTPQPEPGDTAERAPEAAAPDTGTEGGAQGDAQQPGAETAQA